MIDRNFNLIKKHRQSFFLFLCLSVISVAFAILHHWNQSSEESVKSRVQLSDMIPIDFVMVPIELENHDAISDLVDMYALVDLYKMTNNASMYKLAQAVRIIRSPTDRFSVLIPEHQASSFIQSQVPFHAVVQSPDKKDSQIHPILLKKRRHIVFEME